MDPLAGSSWSAPGTVPGFAQALAEAARVAKPGAGLFTEFSGQPQCFLTETQLVSELDRARVALDASVPLTEYNRPGPGALRSGAAPVIYEAAFRHRGDQA